MKDGLSIIVPASNERRTRRFDPIAPPVTFQLSGFPFQVSLPPPPIKMQEYAH
ncbi:MAG: hypothetical protein ACOYM3_25215 [Terrimicrobiaceae bacterium]